MGTKHLTLNQKAKWLPYVIERDGNICFYCEQRFMNTDHRWTRVFDHLNNNAEDNRPENIVLAHWYCNEKKKTDCDWQILAQDKLKENEMQVESLGEGERKKLQHTETNTEIDSNTEFSKTTEEYLIERLFPHHGKSPLENDLDYVETLNNITLRCYRKNKHASQNTVRRILDMFCASEGNFEKVKIDGRYKIRVRREN